MAKGNYYGIDIYNLDRYLAERKETIKVKGGALSLQFVELDGLINISKFSKRFMHKSQSWFSQRLHGALVMRKEQEFKEQEYARIAESFRELARQLNQYADEIDAAE
ncbi:MAG: DUF5053 domain-containing protein [Bacteroidales bacterium]|nr:DUF5053 domain-containing protein [Bacteroidales bacterium]